MEGEKDKSHQANNTLRQNTLKQTKQRKHTLQTPPQISKQNPSNQLRINLIGYWPKDWEAQAPQRTYQNLPEETMRVGYKGPMIVLGPGLGDSSNENGSSLSSHTQVLKLSKQKQSSSLKDYSRVYSVAKTKLPCAGETDSAYLKFRCDNGFMNFLWQNKESHN